MPRPKGLPKTGGRKKGIKNRRTIELEKVAASGMTPLDYLLKVMRDKKQDVAIRVDCAKAGQTSQGSRLKKMGKPYKVYAVKKGAASLSPPVYFRHEIDGEGVESSVKGEKGTPQPGSNQREFNVDFGATQGAVGRSRPNGDRAESPNEAP